MKFREPLGQLQDMRRSALHAIEFLGAADAAALAQDNMRPA
jgi:hypothetical protein